MYHLNCNHNINIRVEHKHGAKLSTYIWYLTLHSSASSLVLWVVNLKTNFLLSFGTFLAKAGKIWNFIGWDTLLLIDNFNLLLSFNETAFYSCLIPSHIPFLRTQISIQNLTANFDQQNNWTTIFTDPCLMYIKPPFPQINSWYLICRTTWRSFSSPRFTNLLCRIYAGYIKTIFKWYQNIFPVKLSKLQCNLLSQTVVNKMQSNIGWLFFFQNPSQNLNLSRQVSHHQVQIFQFFIQEVTNLNQSWK